METNVPRSGLAVQSVEASHSHRAREPFDAAFRCINERRDISPAAKLVHAHLVTLHRTQRDATQSEIGEALGLSRHQVWRAITELVAVDLVQTIRYGLGRPNGYVLLGLAEDDLAGRASASRPPRRPDAGPSGARARVPSSPRNGSKNDRYTPPQSSHCFGCGGAGHELAGCPRVTARRR